MLLFPILRASQRQSRGPFGGAFVLFLRGGGAQEGRVEWECRAGISSVCAPLRHRRHEDMYELRSVRNLVTSKRPDTADTRKQLMLTFLAREEKMFD